jgi:methionine-rich copper-binding protein CopC
MLTIVCALRRLLQGEWFLDDVGEIQQRIVNLFTTEAQDLGGAREFCQLLDRRACSASDTANLLAMNKPKIPWTFSMARRYLLLIAGGLSIQSQDQTLADKRAMLDALCRSLSLSSPGITSKMSEEGVDDNTNHLVSELQSEVEAPEFQDAVTLLQLSDSLERHLVRTTPKDGESCASMPAHVTFYFDDGIVGLSDAGPFHAVKVINLSRDWSSIQGKIEFSDAHATLAFVPVVAFEKQCRYRVLVKPQELVTSFGVTLPKTEEPIAFHFSTPA